MSKSKQAFPADILRGTIQAPPDKSISHRAALFASLSSEDSLITGYSTAADPSSTLYCLEQAGVGVNQQVDPGGLTKTVRITGFGREGWKVAADRSRENGPIEFDCGNSGTTMRLLAGLAGGAGVFGRFTGDASLSSRPMDRILNPLRELGLSSEARKGRYAPFLINSEGIGHHDGSTSEFDLAIASAQIKSAILLAGLFREEGVRVREPAQSRDHTERMLHLPLQDGWLSSSRQTPIPSQNLRVPGDISAMAFWMVAAAIHPNAELTLENTGLNPTRNGIIQALQEMGAQIEIDSIRDDEAEPSGQIRVESTGFLRPIHLQGSQIANLIDELPILMVAMAFANGRSEISDAEELRVKETDRIAAMAQILRDAGCTLKEKPDGVIIEGSPDFKPRSITADSHHDHRIAMSSAVLALRASGPIDILHPECTQISYPSFWEDLSRIC
jgi:3-phosphoshikimate 1-carboxyvinyltransferase